jgi:hypothetical protein
MNEGVVMPTTDKSVLLPFKVHKILKMKATKAEVSMKEYLIRAITKGDDANVVDTEKP